MRLFVWTGGALFVGALTLTAWLFLVFFGQARPFAGPATVAYDVVLFTIFAAHHSVFARESVKRALERTIPESLIQSTYVWIASVLLILVCVLWRPVGGRVYAFTGPLAILFWGVQIFGFAFAAIGVRAIDPLELAGIRAHRQSSELQEGSAYRLVRHPLYLGWILMAFAAPRMTGDRLAFAVVSSAYVLIAIPWEERSLEAQFGEAYRNYKYRVRWRVLPYVY